MSEKPMLELEWSSISDSEKRRLWIEFLRYVQKHGTDGRCRSITHKEFAAICDAPLDSVKTLFRDAINSGAMRKHKGFWVVWPWPSGSGSTRFVAF